MGKFPGKGKAVGRRPSRMGSLYNLATVAAAGLAMRQAKKNIGSKSQSKTKQRKKSKGKRPDTVAGPNTFTKTTYKRQKNSAFEITRKVANLATYQITTTFLTSASESNQSVDLIGSGMGGNVQMVDVFAKAARAYNNTAATNIAQISNATNYKSMKLNWISATQEFQFSNMAPSVSNVFVYHLVAKNTGSYVDPLTSWQNGIQDQDNVATLSNGDVGCLPTASKTFNINWKIISRKRYKLTPGQVVTDVWKFSPNRNIDMEYWNQNGMVRGLTTNSIMVAYGDPVDTNNSASVAGDFVGTAPVKLVGIIKKTYKTNLLNFWPRNTYQNVTALHTGDVTALYDVNIESGLANNISTTTGALLYG